MAPPKIPSSGKNAERARAWLKKVGPKALALLQDPAVRDELVRRGQSFADQVKQWREDRVAEREADGERSSNLDGLRARREQRRLQRRATALQTTIDDLANDQPDAIGALEPLTANLGRIQVGLRVADGLSPQTRREAHLRIAEELTQLERVVFQLSMPTE